MNGVRENPARMSEKMASWPSGSITSFMSIAAVYGSPRVHAELHAQGVRCSRARVARLMREMELAAKRRRHKPMGTLRRPGAPVAPNLLGREFEAEAPNTKWVSDTTYVWTAEGWLYVAVILDLFSRRARRLGDEPAQ